MAPRSLFQSRTYRIACACALALLAYVVARAPLWTQALAGARAELDSGHLALVPGAWDCSAYPHVCSTTVGGEQLVARIDTSSDHPVTCAVTFRGQPVRCVATYWYAPGLKPYLEIGKLAGVTPFEALLERPWRVLDQGLLGESGPLHFLAGFAGSMLLALAASAIIRRGAYWWLLRGAMAVFTLMFVNAGWFLLCFFLGYID